MWMVSLEWLTLALVVCWALGAYRRLKRLRAGAKQAFTAVEAQLMEQLELLRECARMQELKDRVSGTPTLQSHHALIPSANLLASSLEQAARNPLQPESMAALDAAWQGTQVAWQAYIQQSLAYAEAHPSSDEAVQVWNQRWQHMLALQQHKIELFNVSVQNYNRAIAQLPAKVVARMRGFKAGRIFQKDAALLMQPSA